jgi:hypothetical protein
METYITVSRIYKVDVNIHSYVMRAVRLIGATVVFGFFPIKLDD